MPAEQERLAAIRWDGRRLSILDQTLLPFEERWIDLSGAADAAAAIRRLAVRGAPLIGIVAGYALALEIAAKRSAAEATSAAAALREARPTAVNLAGAVDRVLAAAARESDPAAAALAEAAVIAAEEEAASAAIARHGADLLAGVERVLTHCNTGTLAAGGEGTALAVICELARRGPLSVLACEARPLLQGARLTTYELMRRGIPCELIADGAAAGLVAGGEADAVVVGADRVARNGDVANKVGTYGLALAARAAGIPFVVAAPCSTLDPLTATGAEIAIEQRDADEVRRAPGGSLLAPADVPVRNPAFDVTPAELIAAIVTERGAHPPAAVSDLLAAAS